MQFLCCLVILIFMHIIFGIRPFSPLFDEQLINGRVDHRGTSITIESGKTAEEDSKGLGTKEIERPEGGKDRYYFSITSPEEEAEQEEKERKKLENWLEILRNIIIDERKK